MRRVQILGCCSLSCIALITEPASAQDDSEPASTVEPTDGTPKAERIESKGEAPPTAVPHDRNHLHGGQFSLRAGFVGGYRIVSRFDSSPYCQNPIPANANDIKKFCGYSAPPALDLALGYAPFNGFEPFAWARLGLTGERETDTKALVALGLGARLYTSNDSAFKFFIQPGFGWELEKGQGHGNWVGTEYKQDLLIQLLAGPEFDFSRIIGAYAAVGIQAGLLRAIQTWMEYDVGLQVRLPR